MKNFYQLFIQAFKRNELESSSSGSVLCHRMHHYSSASVSEIIEEGVKLLVFVFFVELVLALVRVSEVNNHNPRGPHKYVSGSDVPMKNIDLMNRF